MSAISLALIKSGIDKASRIRLSASSAQQYDVWEGGVPLSFFGRSKTNSTTKTTVAPTMPAILPLLSEIHSFTLFQNEGVGVGFGEFGSGGGFVPSPPPL